MGWLALVGTAVSAGASVQAGAQAEQAAKAQQNIANYNAAVMEREAEAALQKAAFEQTRQAKEAGRVKSRLRAKMAASGVMVGVGTELLIEEEQAAELELESYLIGYEAQTVAARARSQALIDRMGGRLAMRRGKAARTAGYARAGTTLLTGFGEYYAERE